MKVRGCLISFGINFHPNPLKQTITSAFHSGHSHAFLWTIWYKNYDSNRNQLIFLLVALKISLLTLIKCWYFNFKVRVFVSLIRKTWVYIDEIEYKGERFVINVGVIIFVCGIFSLSCFLLSIFFTLRHNFLLHSL